MRHHDDSLAETAGQPIERPVEAQYFPPGHDRRIALKRHDAIEIEKQKLAAHSHRLRALSASQLLKSASEWLSPDQG